MIKAKSSLGAKDAGEHRPAIGSLGRLAIFAWSLLLVMFAPSGRLLLAASLILVPTTVLTFVLVYFPHGSAGLRLMLSGKGFSSLASYGLIVVLACLAYGALFMLAGLFFKNPMVPAILFLGWETLTPFLPTFLKVLSFVHYLVSFAPVPVSLGAFALLARPVPWWIAIVALFVSSAALVFVASRVARHLEVTYSAD